jgi:hypothetical protein
MPAEYRRAYALTRSRCRAALGLDGRGARPHTKHEQLVGCASGLLCRGLRCVFGCAFFGTEVFRQIIQEGVAVGVGDDGAQAFHFFELVRPLLAGHVLLGDAAGVVTRSAGSLHFGLHGSGGKGFAWGAGGLRARQNNGCEQKDCRENSLEQAGSFLSSQNWMSFAFCGCYFFALVCNVDWVALLGAA